MLILTQGVNTLPNIKSAIKRVKVSEKKNLRNRMIKSAMRTSIKKFENAIAAGTCDAAVLSATQGAVDKAASKGVIHKVSTFTLSATFWWGMKRRFAVTHAS